MESYLEKRYSVQQWSQIPIHDRRQFILHARDSKGSHKHKSFNSLLSANVEERMCLLFGACWAQARDLPHCSRPT